MQSVKKTIGIANWTRIKKNQTVTHQLHIEPLCRSSSYQKQQNSIAEKQL